jgi:hypothetical protein
MLELATLSVYKLFALSLYLEILVIPIPILGYLVYKEISKNF